MTTASPRSDMPRTAALDADRRDAWNSLRLFAEWEGEGTPGHEEGRRIIRRAWHRDPVKTEPLLDTVDPTRTAFPVAITAAWDARKANAR